MENPDHTTGASKHWQTEGEHRFNFMTYNAVNYGINVLLSVGAVHWANRTKQGQEFMQSWRGVWEKFLGSGSKMAEVWSRRSLFLTGGFAVLIPVKLLEDSKNYWVKKFNREIYGPQADTNPAITQSEREVEQEPRQNWSSVMGSRVLSLIPFYIFTGFIWEKASWLGKLTKGEAYVDRPIVAASRWMGKTFSRVTGNAEKVEEIAALQRTSPGEFVDGIKGATRDPDSVAVPYTFINEAITSGMVAYAMFLFTRLLAPIIGSKDHIVREAENPATKPSADHQPATKHHGPTTQIHAKELVHHAPAEEQRSAAR